MLSDYIMIRGLKKEELYHINKTNKILKKWVAEQYLQYVGKFCPWNKGERGRDSEAL